MKVENLVLYGAILGTLLLSHRATAQPPPVRFITAPAYPAGAEPRSVAVADFNRDGIPDLAVANYQAVSVLLGKGDGTFQSPLGYPLDSQPQSVAVGDFNGDGIPDLVVAIGNLGNPGVATVWLGNGDGTFQPGQSYSVPGTPAYLAVGDLNSDGNLDLIVANTVTIGQQGYVSVLLGNGDGSFQPAQNQSTGDHPVWVAVGDFNGDGHPDLAVANQSLYASNVEYGLRILLGNGDGTFLAAQDFVMGFEAFSVAVGDFNGDGYLDLAVTTGSIELQIFFGNGHGTFQAGPSYTGVSGRVVVGDFNGDGHLDLAVTASYTANILLGNGDGSFQDPQAYSVGAGPDSIAIGDFNKDGFLDLAVSNYADGTVTILLGEGSGNFHGARVYPVGLPPSSVAVGDFNGDGIPDLAVASQGEPGPGSVSILLGKGDGTFQAISPLAAGYGPNSVAVGDFNGDGKLDLVTANYAQGGDTHHFFIIENDVRVYLGNGDGSFQPAQVYNVGTEPTFVGVGDFNGDNIPDLAVANDRSGSVSVLLAKGDGTFQGAQDYPAPANTLAIADFNGDGKLDILTNGGSLLLGNGDGTFQAGQNVGAGFAGVGDFNGDGVLDLVQVNSLDATVQVFFGNGDGTFRAGTTSQALGFGPNAYSTVVGDFNGDGKLDLAVTNHAYPWSVSVLLGNGDGTFQPAQNYPCGPGPTVMAVGDFNRDGFLDLAVANQFAPAWSVTVLLNAGQGGR